MKLISKIAYVLKSVISEKKIYDIIHKNPCPSESGRHGHDSTIAGDPRIDPDVPLSIFAWVKEHVHSLPDGTTQMR